MKNVVVLSVENLDIYLLAFQIQLMQKEIERGVKIYPNVIIVVVLDTSRETVQMVMTTPRASVKQEVAQYFMMWKKMMMDSRFICKNFNRCL